jgi:peptidoglycan/LPS O-acetylase OafA/YrhL
MRAFASIMGVIYHVALVFADPWRVHVDNIEKGKNLYNVIYFLNVYRIPTFLFVAGYFTLYAVKKYDLKEYIFRRLKRIGIPFFASCVILLPFQAYMSLLFNKSPHILQDLAIVLNPFSAYFSLQHFWFLYNIIIFSIISLLLYSLLKISFISRILKFLTTFRWNAYVIIAGWILLQYGFTKFAQYYDAANNNKGAWITMMNFALFLPFFLFGNFYLVKKDLIDRFLFDGKLRTTIILLMVYTILMIMNIYATSFGLLLAISLKWMMMIVVINLIKIFLNYSSNFLKYISDASYPFYILHQPVIILIGFFYVKHMFFESILLNYLFLVIVCILATYAVYEIIIRHSKIGTLLFTGVFPKRLNKTTKKTAMDSNV